MRQALFGLLVIAPVMAPTMAGAADIHVLTAGAYRGVLDALLPGIEQSTGNHLIVTNETTGVIVRKLRAGDAPDLVILPPSAAKELGPLLGPAAPIAKVGIGVAIAPGTARPDISTEAAIRALALAARAPAWIDPRAGGSSGIAMAGLWERWGIAPQMTAKAVLAQGGLAAEKITAGEADVAFQQISELMAVPGVVVVGPLPASIQHYTVYAAAIPAASTQQAGATAIVAALSGANVAAVLHRYGLETP